jgi:aminoglycoside 6-adenylyltransferase
MENDIIQKIELWAKASDDVKAAIIIGSQAREKYPADQYSDLDLVIVLSNRDYYLFSDQWLKNIGSYWASFTEYTVGGEKERRVLFENASDVDFVMLSDSKIGQLLKDSDVQLLFNRGYRVLVDKIGLAEALPLVSEEHMKYTPISECDFSNMTNDFWFHTVWACKKLLRGELWSAKNCVDFYLKQHLLKMAEFHAHVMNGWDYDTWHNGRFLDIWADPRVKEGLKNAFAVYSKDSIRSALLVTMDLYRLITYEVAEKMGYKYPIKTDKNTTDWVKERSRI